MSIRERALASAKSLRTSLRELLPNTKRAWFDCPAALAMMVAGLALFSLVMFFQLSSLGLPLTVFEGHHWRQSFTYSVAWNFVHESLDVMHPRMFVELAQAQPSHPHSNVVPMEAPLYPLLASVLMRALGGVAGDVGGGDSLIAPRIFSWLGIVLTVSVLWRWLKATPRAEATGLRQTKIDGGVLGDRAALLVSLALTPMVAVEFRAIQPEPFAAGLAVLAAFYFARFGDDEKRSSLVIGAVLYGSSLLSKPLALGIAPSLLLLATWSGNKGSAGDKRAWLTRGMLAAGALALAVMPWFAWDRWAHHLLVRDLGGNWVIEIEHPPRHMLKSLLGGAYSVEALLRLLPSYATSWWLPPAIAAGIYRGLSDRRHRRIAVAFVVWMVGYLVELLSLGERLGSNAYYAVLAVAPLAWFAALGIGALVRLLDSDEERLGVTMFRSALACAVLLPVGTAFSRPSDWKNSVDVAALGFDRNRLVWTTDIALARLLFVLLLVLALAPVIRPRRVPRWLGVPVCGAFIALMFRPAGDAHQYFRFYIASAKRATLDTELASLRRAIDRYAPNKSDRVLISPAGTYREPPMVFFYYAQRNGFPYATGADVEALRRHHARVYLQIDQVERGTHPPVLGRVLATGGWWQLSCVASDGCPD